MSLWTILTTPIPWNRWNFMVKKAPQDGAAPFSNPPYNWTFRAYLLFILLFYLANVISCCVSYGGRWLWVAMEGEGFWEPVCR